MSMTNYDCHTNPPIWFNRTIFNTYFSTTSDFTLVYADAHIFSNSNVCLVYFLEDVFIKHVFASFQGANILRGVAGAGVLSGFDKFKEIYASYRIAN